MSVVDDQGGGAARRRSRLAMLTSMSGAKSSKWEVSAAFQQAAQDVAHNDFEAAMLELNDVKYWELVHKLRIECRALIKDRYYQCVWSVSLLDTRCI